jgi:hypothetical protein
MGETTADPSAAPQDDSYFGRLWKSAATGDCLTSRQQTLKPADSNLPFFGTTEVMPYYEAFDIERLRQYGMRKSNRGSFGCALG